MFSADTPSHSHATRSKRTRQAVGNDDSIKQPLTKKRRSALRRDTFEPLTDASINEVAGRERLDTKPNGHTVEPIKSHARTPSQSQELTLRGKRPEKRSEKGGGQLILSNNKFYTVAQLPSLPDKIRSSPSIPYSCVISPEHDYILALGHTEAFLWPYNSSASTPTARDLVTFTLPFPPASAGDPLPLAAFTAKSASGEPGIVAVSPKWGKVVHWDSIASASSFIPGQTTSGVQGSVPGMLSGETIKELVKAEPAGFILTFSHGRVAHLTIRDQMGRPGIGIQFLRKSATGSASSSFFGSIRNVFAGDRRKGTPIARAVKAAKAQRDIVVGTEDGDLEFWNINLSVGNSLARTVGLRDALLAATQQQFRQDEKHTVNLKVLDFDVVSTPASGHEIARRGDAESTPLLVLAALSSEHENKFALFETVVSDDEVHIKGVHYLHTGSDLQHISQDWRPRISVPNSQAMAFILFQTGIVLISLARIKESPSSQLLLEKSEMPERFQDCIQFQEDSIYRVLGYAAEEIEDEAACVLAVQGFGIVRVTSHLQNEAEVDVEEVESTLGPKTKIEQAIFFGTMRQNPLDLNRASQHKFAQQDIEDAVLRISQEILASTSKYIPRSSPSLDHQMKLRAKALDDLTLHALKLYPYAISINARFQLLWNAEKLAAARAIWKVQEKTQREYPKKDDREFTYLEFVLRALHESRQKYPNPEKGETDRVRYWLIHSVGHIDHLVSELDDCLRELEPMDVKDPRIVCDYMIEAVTIWVAIYETTFKFREDHAANYGLGDEVYKDGVLQRGYPEGLPYPWTSAPEPFRFGQRLLYDVCNFLGEWWDYKTVPNGTTKTKKTKSIPTDLEGKPYDAPSKEAMLQLAYLLPREVDLFINITREETIQAVANIKRTTFDADDRTKKISEINRELRPRMVHAVQAISRYNMPGAINLGERMEDPGLLVELNTQFLKDLEAQAYLNPEVRPEIQNRIREVQQHVESYYDRFGNGWAYAHFSNQIITGNLGRLLAEAQHNNGRKQKYLTWFLKKSKAQGQRVGKLSWINEVLGERRYDRAQNVLENVAREEESDVWSQKTELCLAKLAGLAANEASTESRETRLQMAAKQNLKYDQSLEFLDVQSSIVQYIAASVSDAIDEKAARELALDTFAKRVVDKYPAFKRILTAALDATLTDRSLSLPALVNLLTLIDPTVFTGLPEDDPDILDHEFAVALNSVSLASSSPLSDLSLTQQDLGFLRMLIWRRAMIRDDWLILNNTTGKSDQAVMNAMQSSALFKTLLEVFQVHYRAMTANPGSDNAMRPSNNDVKLSVISPEEILGTSTLLSPGLIDAYLSIIGVDPANSEATKFLNDLAKDSAKEHEKLKQYVEKGQLQSHWEGMVQEGERSVRAWLGVDGNGTENGNGNGHENGIEGDKQGNHKDKDNEIAED